MAFMFEDLSVYKKAMGFLVKVYAVCSNIGGKDIKDQLKRAALSIPSNIAEGQGSIHIKEKKQFYYMARGSLLECIPILQICREIRQVDENQYNELYGLADEVGKMLNGLIRSVHE